MRIGHGYDVHRLVENRKLILGGAHIPFKLGLEGHSDADVLTHAICDALLGAMALGDIGTHFPNTSSKYKNINSLLLLEKVGELLYSENIKIENIDSTIVAQAPKLSSYLNEMRANIAKVLNISIGVVGVKATTEEKLGFTGEGLGIAAHAVCLLSCINEA